MIKRVSTSIGIFVILFIFLLFSLIGYGFLKYQTKINHQKDTEIFFYEVQHKTNILLTKLWHNYEQIKPEMIRVHKEVENYLSTHNYDGSLSEIYKQINQNYKNKPFNIYITDKNLTIVNTTFKPDLGFNLSFAKSSFDKHRDMGGGDRALLSFV